MGSSRFPGKPLAPILGRPMIEHVYCRTIKCSSFKDVVVATCDDEIYQAVKDFGGNAVMTSSKHQRAADRVAEAARQFKAELFVLVQGDEPMTLPEMIEEAIAPFSGDHSVQCVNLTKEITLQEEYLDPNTIKVVMDNNRNALFMSREPIPNIPGGDFSAIKAFKQVCIIPFKKETLRAFEELDPTHLEVIESIDMLRFIENGIQIRMVETKYDTHAVDTPRDLELVSSRMKNDPLTFSY